MREDLKPWSRKVRPNTNKLKAPKEEDMGDTGMLGGWNAWGEDTGLRMYPRKAAREAWDVSIAPIHPNTEN